MNTTLKRPSDERWFGEYGAQPFQEPERHTATPFNRPSDEQWFGPSDMGPDAAIGYWGIASLTTNGLASETIYIQQLGMAVCYYGNTTVGELISAEPNPPTCGGAGAGFTSTGLFNQSATFDVWTNKFDAGCAGVVGAGSVFVSATDRPLRVNGVYVPVDTQYEVTPITLVGAAGDQSGYAGAKTTIQVTVL